MLSTKEIIYIVSGCLFGILLVTLIVLGSLGYLSGPVLQNVVLKNMYGSEGPYFISKNDLKQPGYPLFEPDVVKLTE